MDYKRVKFLLFSYKFYSFCFLDDTLKVYQISFRCLIRLTFAPFSHLPGNKSLTEKSRNNRISNVLKGQTKNKGDLVEKKNTRTLAWVRQIYIFFVFFIDINRISHTHCAPDKRIVSSHQAIHSRVSDAPFSRFIESVTSHQQNDVVFHLFS